ncbi:ABC transporter ATP-binding protein [Orrella marina]|uniref:ABC transporter ATP-binding protein n=1 Tax=Orrella marina TaxID=2163011 RepID=A0A2R4XGC1_9BURK|nr:ABC transporter ATP-binding protein [Orrella marina]AWB32743.1 ABC transporter ATP-binding protein [Orrella marina]
MLDDLDPVVPLPETIYGFCRFLLNEHRRVFAWLFLLGFLVAGADAMVAVFIGKLVGLVGQSDRQVAWDAQWPTLLGLLMVIGVIRPILIWLDLYWRNARLIPGVTTRMRWISHWYVIRQRWGFFQGQSPGQLAHWVMQTPGAIREVAESALRAVWYLGMYGLTSLVLLANADWRLMLPLIVWLVVYVLLLQYFVPKMRALANHNAEQYSHLLSELSDIYGNVLAVRLFGIAATSDERIRTRLRAHEQSQANQMGAVTGLIASLTWLNTFLLVVTAIIGGWLWLHGMVAAAAVAMALPLVWQIAGTGGWVAFEVAGIYQNLGEIRQGMSVIAASNPDLQDPHSDKLQVTHGEIEFESVSFGYPDGAPVLDNFSLRIAPGEKLGIVGRSGAGKSTLMALLLRLVEPDKGRILIDGQDISQFDAGSVREQMAVVTQDVSLFHRSLRENLLCGAGDAREEQLLEALRQADAEHFVAALGNGDPLQGLDTNAGERGSRLSGGQRQRITLARAWLRRAHILILDEATSALDSETEREVLTQVDTLREGMTVISIAHRLSALRGMDRILVMDAGRILESGSHAELLARDGLYGRLWRHQSVRQHSQDSPKEHQLSTSSIETLNRTDT